MVRLGRDTKRKGPVPRKPFDPLELTHKSGCKKVDGACFIVLDYGEER